MHKHSSALGLDQMQIDAGPSRKPSKLKTKILEVLHDTHPGTVMGNATGSEGTPADPELHYEPNRMRGHMGAHLCDHAQGVTSGHNGGLVDRAGTRHRQRNLHVQHNRTQARRSPCVLLCRGLAKLSTRGRACHFMISVWLGAPCVCVSP
jgi:hypothetical protein